MAYIDGFVAAVPASNRETYLDHAKRMAAVMKRHGALRCVETWGDDVPDGKTTSFPMAVKREGDEVVVFSWVWWPDKATRDAGWKAMEQDEEMRAEEMPFDSSRIIYGGFEVVAEA